MAQIPGVESGFAEGEKAARSPGRLCRSSSRRWRLTAGLLGTAHAFVTASILPVSILSAGILVTAGILVAAGFLGAVCISSTAGILVIATGSAGLRQRLELVAGTAYAVTPI